jgi:hypothetical protein
VEARDKAPGETTMPQFEATLKAIDGRRAALATVALAVVPVVLLGRDAAEKEALR